MSDSPGFSDFDYSKIEGIPEVALRLELLGRRLDEAAGGGGASALEVGVGSGDSTLMLARRFDSVTCVDSDEGNCGKVRKRLEDSGLSNVKMIVSRVEDARIEKEAFSHVMLLNMLEHIENPVRVLKLLAGCVRPGGLLHITTPLAGSLHRLLGVEMGMIPAAEELAESDIRFGHYRVYTPELLREQVESAGFRVSYEQPFYLKPLPTSALTPLPMEMHRGLFALGEKLPRFASYIYMEAAR